MLAYCFIRVIDVGPTLNQQWINVLCLLEGYSEKMAHAHRCSSLLSSLIIIITCITQINLISLQVGLYTEQWR